MHGQKIIIHHDIYLVLVNLCQLTLLSKKEKHPHKANIVLTKLKGKNNNYSPVFWQQVREG